MKCPFLPTLLYLLTIGIAKTEADQFAHFLEPGFPFAEITVDARNLGEGLPEDNLSPRGLVVRLADDTYIAYDTDLCRVACAWKGGFLTEESLATMSYHNPKKKKDGGQKVVPSVIGKAIFATGMYPGVQLGAEPKFEDPRPAGRDPKEIGRGALPEGMARWQSTTVLGAKVALEYEIGGISIGEVPSIIGNGVIARLILVGAHPEREVSFVLGTRNCRIQKLPAGARLAQENGFNYLTLPKADKPVRFAALYSIEEIPQKLLDGELPETPKPESHWQAKIVTSGKLGPEDSAYTLDSVQLPLANVQRRDIRPSGIDFFSDGRAVIVTYDGDVWIVSGLTNELRSVTWKRVACGLHEPNSVRVRGMDIFVFGRNGITQLIDTDGDGETNVYKNHSSGFWQSTDSRDFAHSMAFANDGSFFITKGGQQNDFPSKHSGRTLKISPDGKKVSVFASGLRNAYIGIRPGTDEIYASDQQGNWVPATPVHRIVEGGYYGFKTAAPWGAPEPEITPPLCWIPHAVAGSGLGPVWSDKRRFGPLSDSLIYLDFRRPGLIRTYLNDRQGQAATVPMPTKFDFPLLKGAINPIDGQLYLVGFQIWGTSADAVRGMARLRYTGKSSILPTRVVAGKNAITLRFDQPLDPALADITVRRWNYKRSSAYGSGHYRPDGKAGEEILAVGRVTFSADRRSLLIATPELKPVQQLAVSYDLKTASGVAFSNAAYLTLHKVSPLDLKMEGFPNTDLAKLVAWAKSAPKDPRRHEKPTIGRGAMIYQTIGCSACHSTDGSTEGKSGPTWKGLAGSTRTLLGGETIEATPDYLRESILDPATKVTKGYNPKDVGMPSYRGILSDSDVESIVLLIQSLAK